MLLGHNNLTGPRVRFIPGVYYVEPMPNRGGHGARRRCLKVVDLPGGKFGLAEVTWPHRTETALPGEYATEQEAEQAARGEDHATDEEETVSD